MPDNNLMNKQISDFDKKTSKNDATLVKSKA